jgi:hypothetical protein
MSGGIWDVRVSWDGWRLMDGLDGDDKNQPCIDEERT